jgi:putative ABC transport system substrate-binding protein
LKASTGPRAATSPGPRKAAPRSNGARHICEKGRRNVALFILPPGTTVGAVAAKKTTSTVPVVFVIGADPIKSGLVAQLNHPGANLTGVSSFTNQMESKRFGLLHELVTNVELISVLLNANNPFFDSQMKDLNEASRALGVKVDVERTSTEAENRQCL